MDLMDQQDGNPPAQQIPTSSTGTRLSAVARDDLLGDFGHQLRNELNAIVSAAGMLSATATTSEQRELSAIVETGANRVARLLDDVLDSGSSRAAISNWRCIRSTSGPASSRAWAWSWQRP